MAIREHLKIFKKGVREWNKWRADNPDILPDISGTEIVSRKLDGINLCRANLNGVNMRLSSFRNANFKETPLDEGQIQQTDFTGANFYGARFLMAHVFLGTFDKTDFRNVRIAISHFIDSSFRGANFRDVQVNSSAFAGVNFTNTVGLAHVWFHGITSIGIDTFFQSQGSIPEKFLRGAGVPDIFIHYASSLTGAAFEFYSAFISYSAKDEDFAKRLHSDLQTNGVRCWLFPEDAKWGEPMWSEIDRGIKVHEKLLVICSEQSLQSEPVLREIERALQREDKEKKQVLFPIRIDDYLFHKWEHHRKADVASKVVGDMRNWKNRNSYQKAFARLLKNFKSDKPIVSH